MDVSENIGTPKSSFLVGFSIINHPFWGTPIFGNTRMYKWKYKDAEGRFSCVDCVHVRSLQPGQKISADEPHV